LLHRDALTRVVDQVVAPGAADTDAKAEFPRRQLTALAEAGLLGLTVPTDFGGAGGSLRDAADVVRELGAVCGSTAMVVTMHYSATAALIAAQAADSLTTIAGGGHLCSLAFSETGSRSQFWVPMSTARSNGDEVILDASKSWVTAAGQADSYIWSSRPVAAAGPMTLWQVPGNAAGLSVAGAFDGLGLRGNASSPMSADSVRVPQTAIIGADGGGLDLALTAVLPVFLICSAAMSTGLMSRLVEETTRHLQQTQLQHLGQSLAQHIQPRAHLARLRIEADQARGLLNDTLDALEQERPDALIQVLAIKAAAGEAAAGAADLALRACGGAAFRKESPVERLFRDSRAARVMAPTTEALLDFVGRAMCGLPLFGDA
jgi:isovaleryl-CoA dehydrogenase